MHGGNIYDGTITLDCSVNLNPLGIPEGVRKALETSLAMADTYPDPENTALREALSLRLGIPMKQILAGNGASELIPAIVRAVHPLRALLPSPCFSGYERAFHSIGVMPSFFPLARERGFLPGPEFLDAIDRVRPDLVFLTNPENPSGALLARDLILAAADRLAFFGGVLVCDECFLALSGRREASVLREPEDFRKRPNLVLLNAFTKTYAIPGIRLGFAAFSDPVLAEKVSLQLSEWNLSVVSQAAGLACLQVPDSYLADSIQLIRTEREVLRKSLTRLGAIVSPSEANYLLFRWRNQDTDLYARCRAQGVLIRDCSDYRGLEKGDYRIAVRTKRENERLLACLEEIAAQEGTQQEETQQEETQR
ncbi:MAG: pyridoxal phosphate-dependent aminotransferase [Lachnospiraceae bacterium]